MNYSYIDNYLREKVTGKIPPPDDFVKKHGALQAEYMFLKHIRDLHSICQTANHRNAEMMLKDFKFLAGDQWEPANVERRRKNKLPCLVFNRLLAFVSMVMGERSYTQTSIKIRPDKGGTKEVAELRQGMIRYIEKTSRAQRAYERAHLNQVICGDGAFYINLSYVTNDVFDQQLTIDPVENQLSVLWDHMSSDPTGADAQYVFLTESMSRTDFERTYPKADTAGFMDHTYPGAGTEHMSWFAQDTVKIARFYRMRYRTALLAMLGDGTVQDISSLSDEEMARILPEVAQSEEGEPFIRETKLPYVEMYVTNGMQLLDGPVVFKCSRLPVIRAVGWDLSYGGTRTRWGLVRFLQDPQRLHNYWRSILAERLMSAPRAKWLAQADAVHGYESAYRDSASSMDPLLMWNGEAGVAPQQVAPIPLEPALIQEAGMAAQDLRDISNMHESSLGMSSNEVSGKAINARQRQSSLSLHVYGQNLNRAIEEAGRVLNELIPYAYDAPRMIKIVGDDDNEEVVSVNTVGSLDITAGKYTVSVTTSPTYETKRMEAAEAMMGMVNAMPDTLSIVSPDIIEAQDWPGADRISRKLRERLDPNSVDPSKMSPEELQAREQAQQMQQMQAELQLEMAKADLAFKQAQSAEALARAEQAMALAFKSKVDAGVSEAKALADMEESRVNTLLNVMKEEREDMIASRPEPKPSSPKQ